MSINSSPWSWILTFSPYVKSWAASSGAVVDSSTCFFRSSGLTRSHPELFTRDVWNVFDFTINLFFFFFGQRQNLFHAFSNKSVEDAGVCIITILYRKGNTDSSNKTASFIAPRCLDCIIPNNQSVWGFSWIGQMILTLQNYNQRDVSFSYRQKPIGTDPSVLINQMLLFKLVGTSQLKSF